MSALRRRPTSTAARVNLAVVGALLAAFDAAAQPAAPQFAMVPVGKVPAAAITAPQGTIRINGSTTVRLCDCTDRDIDFTVTPTGAKPLTVQEDEQPRIVEVLLDAVRVSPDPFADTASAQE